MDSSAYAFSHGLADTRRALAKWNQRPLAVLGGWAAGSLCAALLLLTAVFVIGSLAHGSDSADLTIAPLQTGSWHTVLSILERNCLVLALHAMACVAGFMAGSSLPLQAAELSGFAKTVHEQGGRLAILFVCGATIFSLSAQSYVLGTTVANVSHELHVAPGLLLLGLLPHAIVELVALFLPLAAWIMASRRDQWDELLAATVVTLAVALPMLALAATWEVFGAPHVLHALIAYSTHPGG